MRQAHCAQASTAKNNGNLNGISQIAGRKLIPIFKNKGDISSNAIFYRGIKYFKLTSLFMKLWERIIEARLREIINIRDNEFGFRPGVSTTEPVFALRQL